MHEESSYEGLDLIECEVRRRTFWLLFGGKRPDFCDCLPRLISPGKLYSHRSCDLARFPTRTYTHARARTRPTADKSMSILLGRPICLRDEDTTCNFPRELDDE